MWYGSLALEEIASCVQVPFKGDDYLHIEAEKF